MLDKIENDMSYYLRDFYAGSRYYKSKDYHFIENISASSTHFVENSEINNSKFYIKLEMENDN